MSYLVLARKYRPQTFAEVVGQKHVTQTLQNAIDNGRVAHGLLFAGPRGTGKTTIARVLAKAVNCEKGPAAEPCNQCRSCLEITGGNDVDVFEIDGASNNGVEQVRELRENVKYMPANSPYKIYIIDEVHMLSVAAFNALLKTLEEPPAHIMFLFATTEVHKIPITILSRCQRHDLRRVETADIVDHLKMLCEKEGFLAQDESLWMIAREADGSMRDGLSLLDQIMACSEGEIDQNQIQDVLGLIDHTIRGELTRAILAADMAAILDAIDDLHGRGFDIKKLYSDLLVHFRNLLVIKLGNKAERLVDLPRYEIEQLKTQIKDVSVAYLNQLFDVLYKQEASIKFAVQPKLALEMAFMRLLVVKPVLPIDELVQKLDALRDEVGSQPVLEDRKVAPAPRIDSVAEANQNTPTDAPAPKAASAAVATNQQVKPVAPSQSAAPPVSEAGGNDNQKWAAVCEALRETAPVLSANLTRCKVEAIDETLLTLVLAGNGFVQSIIKRANNMALLKETCAGQWGRPLDIKLKIGKDDSKKRQQNAAEKEGLTKEALGHPRVAEAMEVFAGKVVDVKIL
jgi:DNA polymerase III subunit gamma/tau